MSTSIPTSANIATGVDNDENNHDNEEYIKKTLKQTRDQHVKLCNEHSILQEELAELRQKHMDNEMELAASAIDLNLVKQEATRKCKRVDELSEEVRVKDEEIAQLVNAEKEKDEAQATIRGLIKKLQSARCSITSLRKIITTRDVTIERKTSEFKTVRIMSTLLVQTLYYSTQATVRRRHEGQDDRMVQTKPRCNT